MSVLFNRRLKRDAETNNVEHADQAFPLAKILEDHYHLRQTMDRLVRFCHNFPGTIDRAEAESLWQILAREMPLHLEDEEEVLIPLLRRRIYEDADAMAVLSQVVAEHAEQDQRLSITTEGLKQLSMGQSLPDPNTFCAQATFYAECEKRHIAWENAIVLPLARRHLTHSDLITLQQSMEARRAATV